jgi:multidrug efflux pump subunit AcrB
MVKLPVAALIIVLLLVGQFNSFRRPAIILITIPLGIIGVVIGLIVLRSYFGFMTLLGIIALSGIVINNAIVLLDRIRIEIEENGLEPQRAVVESAQRRLRPILLTTGTTIGGLLPLYLGGGPMWEPMAVAIMFGLLFATALTLGVVPVLYSLFFRVTYRDFDY